MYQIALFRIQKSSSEQTMTSSKFISLIKLDSPVKSSKYFGLSEVASNNWNPFCANSSSTFWLQAVQLENLWVVGLVKWKLLMEPRKEWNVSPSGPSSFSAWPMLDEAINPCGCWRTEAISSTANAAAWYETPGLVTVHCWSNVRSFVESPGATTSLQK